MNLVRFSDYALDWEGASGKFTLSVLACGPNSVFILTPCLLLLADSEQIAHVIIWVIAALVATAVTVAIVITSAHIMVQEYRLNRLRTDLREIGKECSEAELRQMLAEENFYVGLK